MISTWLVTRRYTKSTCLNLVNLIQLSKYFLQCLYVTCIAGDGCGTESSSRLSVVVDTNVSDPTNLEKRTMNNIIYIVGAVVIVLFILSFIGIV